LHRLPPALVLIDLQLAIDDPSWGQRNNPLAESNARKLLDLWREKRWPLFHVRHDSTTPGSTYAPGQPLHAFKPEPAPLPGETVLGKTTCNAFASTDLLFRLNGAETYFCGVVTNNSVESTVRAAGDLGVKAFLVEDACFTVAKGRWSADEVHAMSLANLDGEYCTVVTTASVEACLKIWPDSR